MSVQAITAAYQAMGVSSAEKFLLVTLANYADQNMKCWPSQRRLCLDMCLSPRQMVNLFKSLEEKHLIRREPQPRRKDGSRNSMMVTLTLHSAMAALRLEAQGADSALTIVQSVPNQRAAIAPKPSENLQENRQRAREAEAASAASRALVAEGMKELAASLRKPIPAITSRSPRTRS